MQQKPADQILRKELERFKSFDRQSEDTRFTLDPFIGEILIGPCLRLDVRRDDPNDRRPLIVDHRFFFSKALLLKVWC